MRNFQLITYSQSSERSKEDWDNFCSKFSLVPFFCSWDWGDFESESGVEYYRDVVLEDGKVVAIMPVKIIRAKRGSQALCRRAPLLDWGDVELRDYVIDSLKKSPNVSLLNINPPVQSGASDILASLKRYGFKDVPGHSIDANRTIVIDLKTSEDQLLADMRKNTRYYVKKAQKEGVEVVVAKSDEYIDEFIKIYSDSKERKGWTGFSSDYVAKQFRFLNERGFSKMFLAKYKGEFISAAIFTKYNDTVIYHHSGSLNKYLDIPSMYILQWEAIKYWKAEGLKFYDMWGVGSGGDDDNMKGVSLFKRGFGGKEMEFIRSQYLILKPSGWLTYFYDWLESRLH